MPNFTVVLCLAGHRCALTGLPQDHRSQAEVLSALARWATEEADSQDTLDKFEQRTLEEWREEHRPG